MGIRRDNKVIEDFGQKTKVERDNKQVENSAIGAQTRNNKASIR